MSGGGGGNVTGDCAAAVFSIRPGLGSTGRDAHRGGREGVCAASARAARVRAGYALVRPSRVRGSCELTVASRGWRRRGCRSASPGQEAGLWSVRCPGRVPAGRAGGGGCSACRARLCAVSSGLEQAQLMEGLAKVVMRRECAGKARGLCFRVAAGCSRPQQG